MDSLAISNYVKETLKQIEYFPDTLFESILNNAAFSILYSQTEEVVMPLNSKR